MRDKQLDSFYQTSEEYLAKISSGSDEYYGEYVSFVAAYLPAESRYLDLGCGSGNTTEFLSHQYSVVGLDVSRLFLDHARGRNSELTFVQGSLTDLPFDDNSFDAAGLYNVIEHIPDIDQAVAEMSRVVKPGGLIFINAPNLLSPRYPLDVLRHRQRMTYEGEKTAIGLMQMFIRNVTLLALKRIGILRSYQMRKPILDTMFSDADAVWHCNPLDIARILRRHNTNILKYQPMDYMSNKPLSGRVLNKVLPSSGGLVRIVAIKK